MAVDRDMDERTLKFAVRVLKMAGALPRSTAAAIVSRQVVRSATSIGANVTEAQGACIKRDFVRQINIARGEARETLYWLRLIGEGGLLPTRKLAELMKEADELVRILTAIVKNSGIKRLSS